MIRQFLLTALSIASVSMAQPLDRFSQRAVQRDETLVRETHTVRVHRGLEQWSLVWRAAPRPVCRPEDESATTCPCTGFAYGEMGLLDLVRRRPGNSDEVLPLAPLFKGEESPTDSGLAVLQRWPVISSDYRAADKHTLAHAVQERDKASVLMPRDYDHDGHATEFVLQVGTLPCGRREAVVVGVSASLPTLHAFSSQSHPGRPLVLEASIWEKLRISNGRVSAIEWQCGDHGADTETEVSIVTGPAGIDGVRREYACTSSGKRGKLLSTIAI